MEGKFLLDVIPVRMHEYTVVALHPNLIEKDGFIVLDTVKKLF